MTANGETHTASSANIPNMPTVLRMDSAPATTVDAASEIMPPTTGSAVEIAVFANFDATASPPEAMIELMLIYAVKPSDIAIIKSVLKRFKSEDISQRLLLPKAAAAMPTARYA